MKRLHLFTLLFSASLLPLASNTVHASQKQKLAARKNATAAQAKTVAAANANRVALADPQTGPQTLMVSPQGDDTAAVRGGAQPFATLAAALAQAQAGDTVHLTAGQFPVSGTLSCSVPIALTGAGVRATTVVPDDSTSMFFRAATQIQGINFDTGANADHTNGRQLLDVSFTDGSIVTNCRFHGINSTCINGNGNTNTSFTNLEFDHVYLPVFIDSSVGNYPGRLAFRNCNANHVIAGGFIVHSLQSYQNGDMSKALVQQSSGLDFIKCSVKDSPNSLGFEVWHGWTDIHFTRCAVEDCLFGYSISGCDHATLTSCTSNNCGFLFENAGSHDTTFVNCVADARPTATSPYAGQPVAVCTQVVVSNGPSYAVKWVGGAIKGAVFHAFTGQDISLLGATMSSSLVRIQNASNITVQGCTFNQLTGLPPAYNWWVVDCGQQNLSNIIFDGNECLGTTPYAGMEIYGMPHSIDNLQITGNHTDGVYNGCGFVHDQGVTFTNLVCAGNTTDHPNSVYPGNACFPDNTEND